VRDAFEEPRDAFEHLRDVFEHLKDAFDELRDAFEEPWDAFEEPWDAFEYLKDGFDELRDGFEKKTQRAEKRNIRHRNRCKDNIKTAILNTASGLVVAHNHPSGNMTQSEADIKITRKIKETGSLVDVQLLDHLIINDSDYYSFADNGML